MILNSHRNNSVKVRMAGELGNQLFQLIIGLVASKNSDSKLELEFTSLEENRLTPYIFYNSQNLKISQYSKNQKSFLQNFLPNFNYQRKLLKKLFRSKKVQNLIAKLGLKKGGVGNSQSRFHIIMIKMC